MGKSSNKVVNSTESWQDRFTIEFSREFRFEGATVRPAGFETRIDHPDEPSAMLQVDLKFVDWL